MDAEDRVRSLKGSHLDADGASLSGTEWMAAGSSGVTRRYWIGPFQGPGAFAGLGQASLKATQLIASGGARDERNPTVRSFK